MDWFDKACCLTLAQSEVGDRDMPTAAVIPATPAPLHVGQYGVSAVIENELTEL
jgi:hypothetical protein